MEFATQHNLAQLAAAIAADAAPRRIIITSHANPDGDALGSSIGLQFLLEALGHTVSVIMPTELPSFLDWMPLFERVLVSETHAQRCQEFIQSADIIFSLDYNALSRVNEVGEWIAKSKAMKVMIDHHINPQLFADAHYWRTDVSSTCELVYELIVKFGYLEMMPKSGLECLYIGLLTDTGGFRHATSANLFRIVADMLERGIDNNRLCDLVFNTYTVKRFRLLTYGTSQAMEILEDIGAAIIVLSQKDHEDLDIRRGDAEGLVNFALSIKILKVAVMVSERKDGIKLSMRSKDDFSVQEICHQYFNGGGHRNASGGSSSLSLADTLTKLRSILYQKLT
jgi:bifunctional oligoribonuclease and PAP phosphatase NrnA